MNARFGWMGLGVCILLLAIIARAENEAKFYPNGKLYIPKVQMLDYDNSVVASYQATLKKKKGKEWVFQLTGLSSADKPANVTGSWTFKFDKVGGYRYENSKWSWETNTEPISYNVVLTQNTDYTVSGSIATNMLFDGIVAGEDLYFVILTGTGSNQARLLSCQCMVESNVMDGVFYYTWTNGSTIAAGDFTGTR